MGESRKMGGPYTGRVLCDSKTGTGWSKTDTGIKYLIPYLGRVSTIVYYMCQLSVRLSVRMFTNYFSPVCPTEGIHISMEFLGDGECHGGIIL